MGLAAGTTVGNELIGLRAVGTDRYDSIMCSIEQRLAEIGQALEELAIHARMPADGKECNGGVGSGQAAEGQVGTVAVGGGEVADSTVGGGEVADGTVGGGAVGEGETAASAVGDGEASTDTKESAVAIEADDSGRILTRLAELWGLLAELDPEVARRLSGYQALLYPAGLHRGFLPGRSLSSDLTRSLPTRSAA